MTYTGLPGIHKPRVALSYVNTKAQDSITVVLPFSTAKLRPSLR